MTFSRSPGDAYSPIFIPPPLTFSHLAEFRAAFEQCDRAGLLEFDASRRRPRGTTVPRALAIRTIVGRCFPRLIEAKCEVETCQTLQALQTVMTDREFLSLRWESGQSAAPVRVGLVSVSMMASLLVVA